MVFMALIHDNIAIYYTEWPCIGRDSYNYVNLCVRMLCTLLCGLHTSYRMLVPNQHAEGHWKVHVSMVLTSAAAVILPEVKHLIPFLWWLQPLITSIVLLLLSSVGHPKGVGVNDHI